MKTIDGHDNAFVGMSLIWRDQQRVEVAVYSGDVIISNLMAQGMSEAEAIEYTAFNIEDAYVGLDTPVVYWQFDLEEAIELHI
jgi:uncharacterized protein YoaH (UPF0181 family)